MSAMDHLIVLATNHSISHRHVAGVNPSYGFSMWGPASMVFSDTGKPFIIPVVGLTVGYSIMKLTTQKDVGKLVVYFGAQSFMNIFMGWVMGSHITLAAGAVLPSGEVLKQDLTGCPAGFALTAMQQVVSFIVFVVYYAAVYYTPNRYNLKKLTTNTEYISVVVFGCVFALNIALNNFSLGYISIAVNLIIRSCLPLTTFLSTQGLAVVGLSKFKPCKWLEIFLMAFGVVCAGVFTVAQLAGGGGGDDAADFGSQLIGVIACVASLLCGSLNLALAGLLGEMKMEVFDTVAYMSIPATLFLLPLCLVQKEVPGDWQTVFNTTMMSDLDILQGVMVVSPNTMLWLILSGVFSFGYNVIQFTIVHTLSPSATAFGGNFNKAALIFMTLLFPFLQVHPNPGFPYIQIIWSAVMCNILAFSAYSYLQILAKKEAEEKAAQLKLVNDEETDPMTGKE